MEVSSLNGLQNDEEEALNSLLDAFGSLFSLNDIASAYCEAGRDPDLAGLILCEMQGIPPLVATDQSNNEVKNNETSGSSYVKSSQNNSQASEVFMVDQPVSAATDECSGKRKKDEHRESSRCNSFEHSCQENGGLRSPKQKVRPVSGGTVSSMLGKGYMKSVPLANGSNPGTKPMKVDSKEMPMSLFWGEELEPSSQNEDRMHKDMEDFLFKMLGEGFRLERDVIREVLNSCGYNMQKSMKKLLDWSAVSLDKEKKPLGESGEKTNDIHLRTSRTSQENMNIVLNADVAERQQKDRNDLQKEVLATLFNAPERSDELPERSEELPRRSKKPARRPIALGEIVERPLIDVTAEPKVDRVCSQEDKKDDEDEEDSFQVLRRAVKEYRGTMKEYYKAAVDAFAKGDQDEANKLLEQGQFFQEKARQADEESNQKIFETRNTETEDEMLLELHNHGTREAIQLLKCHLSSPEIVSTEEEGNRRNEGVDAEEEDEDALEERRRRIREKMLQRKQEETPLLEEEEEEEVEEEEEEESEYETDSEEEHMGIAMAKAVFVPKSERETIAERKRLEEEERAMEEAVKRKLEHRKIETRQIVVEKIREDTEIQKNMELEANIEDVDTDDELNEAEEYEAWKAREIARIKRDREEREAMIKEREEIEKVRNMTEEERREWERKNPKPAPPPKQKWRFMQKYYHKGAFFQTDADDPAATAGAQNIYHRDFSAPTGDDKMDKTILPKVMQVKHFGRSGRTKWTHLVNEDTTDWNNPWTYNDPLRAKYNAKMAAVNVPIAKPKGSKKLKDWEMK